IPLLVDSFLAELEPEFGQRSIGRDALAELATYPWPGNVRELRHAVHRAVALSSHELRLVDLMPRRTTPTHHPLASASGASEGGINLVDAAMRDLMRDAYSRHGSVRRAAAALGLPKSTFADRARKLGII
ncbi:MAG TPA: hypothetical protein VNO33_13425, partial [Kofleriaceae bacterium]|nr:hypothetical protein [Kofleriaceae bacterium]